MSLHAVNKYLPGIECAPVKLRASIGDVAPVAFLGSALFEALAAAAMLPSLLRATLGRNVPENCFNPFMPKINKPPSNVSPTACIGTKWSGQCHSLHHCFPMPPRQLRSIQ